MLFVWIGRAQKGAAAEEPHATLSEDEADKAVADDRAFQMLIDQAYSLNGCSAKPLATKLQSICKAQNHSAIKAAVQAAVDMCKPEGSAILRSCCVEQKPAGPYHYLMFHDEVRPSGLR